MMIPFGIESAQSRSLPLSAQRIVNMFVERQPPDAKSQTPIFGVPGLSLFTTCGDGPHRGSWNFKGTPYFVSGTSLYRTLADGTTARVGVGIGGSGPVSMSDNGVQLGIVNGQSGWMYSPSGGLVQITSSAFQPANTITFVDGYFLFDAANTNQWFWSGLYDGLSYSGLDFISAEAESGYVTGLASNLQLIFIFTTTHIELFYDAGTADVPFQRYAGGVIDYGCISPYSIIKQDGALFFLGRDKVFYRLQGNVPIRISTHPIEHILTQETDLHMVEANTFTLEGHKIINWTLPSGNRTISYDISTSKWHERSSRDEDNRDLGRWRGRTALNAFQKTLIGDAFDGRLGVLDWTTYSEYGNPIEGIVHSAPQHADRKRIICYNLELDIQAGVGLTAGQGSDPQIMLERSIDGGYSFGVIQPWRSMGKIGEYLTRLRWLQQGNGRQMMWRLTISDPVPRVIIAAHAAIEVGI